jgi:lipoprotein-anchoring transpeptidase ErfK/SrfK
MSLVHIVPFSVMFVCCLGLVMPAHAERIVTVDFTNAELRITDTEGALYLHTPVVLPKGSYYQVPVQGTVRRAVMGPTWKPTPRTLAEMPGRFKEYYGPYEQGNAMGHCKVYIDFDRKDASLQYVRIHGNARDDDLGKRLSRSCIRIPDVVCPELVNVVAGYSGRVRVHFLE